VQQHHLDLNESSLLRGAARIFLTVAMIACFAASAVLFFRCLRILYGRWVVYEKRGVEYVHRSKQFKTKREAEKERERLHQNREVRRKALGVSFTR
jgi:hypothetical protein